jgi:hypothetical protein
VQGHPGGVWRAVGGGSGIPVSGKPFFWERSRATPPHPGPLLPQAPCFPLHHAPPRPAPTCMHPWTLLEQECERRKDALLRGVGRAVGGGKWGLTVRHFFPARMVVGGI